MKYLSKVIKCLPISLTTIKKLGNITEEFPLCQKIIRKYWPIIKSERKKCKNPCHIVEYVGRSEEPIDENGIDTLYLIISFVSNEVKMQEEYLIYSEVDLIGIIGGNLGLFVGFSFFGKIKQLIYLITYHLQN